MPNIRIAFMISKFRYDLNAESLNTSSEAEEPEMTDNSSPPDGSPLKAAASETERKPLPEAAKRALAEAEARRQAAAANAHPAAKELQGPKGLEPARYGDWENKGIASDF
jgi:hypothetical protein